MAPRPEDEIIDGEFTVEEDPQGSLDHILDDPAGQYEGRRIDLATSDASLSWMRQRVTLEDFLAGRCDSPRTEDLWAHTHTRI